jgi:hypothetical protein
MGCSTILTPQKVIRPSEARNDWLSEETRITTLQKKIANQRKVIADLDEDICEISEKSKSLASTEDAQEILEIQQHRARAM